MPPFFLFLSAVTLCLTNVDYFVKFIVRNGIATLAQLVEQLTRNEQVVGSSPTGGSGYNQQKDPFQ